MSALETVRSVLVYEETDESITIRAASDRGTIPSAVGLWWTLARHRWLPYRWSRYDFADDDFLDNPTRTGWRWGRWTFWERDHMTSAK